MNLRDFLSEELLLSLFIPRHFVSSFDGFT